MIYTAELEVDGLSPWDSFVLSVNDVFDAYIQQYGEKLVSPNGTDDLYLLRGRALDDLCETFRLDPYNGDKPLWAKKTSLRLTRCPLGNEKYRIIW